MQQITKLPLLPILLLLITGCAATYQPIYKPSANEQLAKQINQQISIPELNAALVGIMVQSAETGEIIYQHNANTLMTPASNEKIPTAAAALLKFGPDFKYQTKIYTNGSIEQGVLNGDLIIVGSGDPTLGSSFYDSHDSCFFFQAWADSLKSKGIEKINGNIIGVDNVFDDELIGSGWQIDDASYYYGAQICGLTFHENFARVKVESDSSGKEINIKVLPDYDYLQIEPKLEFSDSETDIEIQRILNSNRISICGTIEPGTKLSERISVHNPTLYCVSALKKELLQLGIKISGKVIDADELQDGITLNENGLIFSHFSIPMLEVLKILMK